jgi:hypothetical protein
MGKEIRMPRNIQHLKQNVMTYFIPEEIYAYPVFYVTVFSEQIVMVNVVKREDSN